MIRRKTSELLIRPRMSARQRLAMTTIVVIVIVAVLYAVYQFGAQSVQADFVSNRARIAELEKQVAGLNKVNGELQTDLALVERQSQIQVQAYKEVSDAYADVVEKNEFLNRRLDFYRSIISPEDGKAGIKIHDFKIKYAEDGTSLLFDLTLVQSIKHNTNVRAEVVVGLYRNGDKQQPIAVWPEQDGKSVNFKYYEKISDELIVPDFQNESAEELSFKVDVNIRGGKGGDVEKWYPLPSVETKTK